MDQEVIASPNNDVVSLGHKAWTAYVGITLLAFVCVLFGVVPLAWHSSVMAGCIVLVMTLVVVTLKVLSLRSYHLYYDDAGVWISNGILPWTKGRRGVKWRDFDNAGYFPSMWSWMFRSYSVQIEHRFTKANEILLSHIARGDKAVSTINGRHQELVRADLLR